MKSDKAKQPETKEAKQKEQNRERQRRYREKALCEVDGLLLTRLQVMISANADGALKRLVKATGKTKREVIEEAVLEMQKRYSVTYD